MPFLYASTIISSSCFVALKLKDGSVSKENQSISVISKFGSPASPIGACLGQGGESGDDGVPNRLRHWRGVLSMARSSDPNSASSQFFIVHQDANFLDGDYAAFGAVIQGFDTLDALATVETNDQDRPLEDVVMLSVRLLER